MQAIDHISARYRSHFKRGSFGHNVLVMFTGTAIGQLSSVLLSPLLTRIYTPDMFGVLGIFTAIVSIFAVIAALRYEMALPIAASEEDAANLLAVCMAALVFTTFVGALIVCLPIDWDVLAPYRWLLPAGFFCIGAYQVLIYFATRQGAFSTIARTKVYQGGVGPVSQIVMGLMGAGPWGLLIGFIAGQSAGITMLFTRLVLATHTMRKASLSGMKAMAIRFRHFPMISSWSSLIEAAGGSFILLVAIPLLYSNTIAGFVFLTDRIIARPLLLVSTSILQVYVGDMSRSVAADPAALQTRFLQLARHQFLIVAGWLLLMNLLAPFMFPFVFGKEWQGAVPYLQVLSIAYLPQMVMHALIHTLQVLERQGLSAIWETGRLIAVVSAFAISYSQGSNALHATLVYSIVQATAQVILFILMYRSINALKKQASHA